ncbi:MAG: 4-(cytidine 5'-diphospho)-2-C-methyl-D-erythritol kinase [Actinomycetes bacterium]
MTAAIQDLAPKHCTVKVPAKINLSLKVAPLGEDGFHELATVFHAVSIYDEVTISKVRPGQEEISVAGDDSEKVPTNKDNLVNKAITEIAKHVNQPIHARVHIHKSIPIAGGMAGGSADAAATILVINHLWEFHLTIDELNSIAAKVGSDVPFLLHGNTALGYGRGEQLTPVLHRNSLHWVIATSNDGLSTPEVYAEFDHLTKDKEVEDPEISLELLKALAAGDPNEVANNLVNDLQPAAISLKPELRRLLRAGEDAGALKGIVSGSGPTCVFLCFDDTAASDIAIDLLSSGTCKHAVTAYGPVPGARIK